MVAVPALGLVLALPAASAEASAPAGTWTFAVSGDSRDCGDVVMPAIARGARRRRAARGPEDGGLPRGEPLVGRLTPR